MISTRPHFLLFCDGSLPSANKENVSYRGRWRFVLEDVEGNERLEASDAESLQPPDRLALLAVVRGLEALSQPSRVTLVTTSRYVNRGLQYGLPEWRENEYCWEHFGALQPIRNADLWQRIDGALQYHEIQCRLMSGDDPASSAELEIQAESLGKERIAKETEPNLEDCMVTAKQELAVEQEPIQVKLAAAASSSQAESLTDKLRVAGNGWIGLGKLLRVCFLYWWRRWAGTPLMMSAV